MPFCFLLKPKTTFFTSLVITRCTSHYHLLYNSLTLVVTQYITGLSFYKQSRKSYICQKNLKNTIEFNNNRYIAKLPTKKMNELPPDNHTVARKRLDYLEKQLTKEDGFEKNRRVIHRVTTSGNKCCNE